MMRNTVRALLFAAVFGFAATASAQTISYKTSGTVQGKTLAASAITEAGRFTVTASIDSVLNFTIGNATLNCGTVAVGSSSCPTNTPATLTVTANSNWYITINDGTDYDTTNSATKADKVTMNGPGGSSFVLDLTASPTAGATQVHSANSNIAVSITAAPHTSEPTVAGRTIDVTDWHGSYSGNFVVVLFEAT